MDSKITAKELRLRASYRHEPNSDGTVTLCGLAPEYTAPDKPTIVITLRCDCGHPDCTKPVNCPVCLAMLSPANAS